MILEGPCIRMDGCVGYVYIRCVYHGWASGAEGGDWLEQEQEREKEQGGGKGTVAATTGMAPLQPVQLRVRACVD